MEDFVFVASIMKLFYALLGLGIVFGFLRYLDHRAGLCFKEFFNDLKESPMAAAVYLGSRFVGACLLIGLIIS